MTQHELRAEPAVAPSDALELLHGAAEMLGASLAYDETLRRVAQSVVPDVADWCGLYIADRDGTEREVTSEHPDAEVEAVIRAIRARRRRSAGTSESRAVWESGEPILVGDVGAHDAPDVGPEERRILTRVAPASYMIVPLRAHGRLLGSMTMLSTRERRHYTDEDLRFAQTLASRFALAIDHARLYDAAEQSQRLLDTIFATAPVGLAVVDRELRYLRINDALAAINGRSVEDHIGRTVHEVLGPFGDAIADTYRCVLATGEPVLDQELTGHTPGAADERSWSSSYTPVRGRDGELIGVSAVVIDITERRRLLEAEREARKRADFLAAAGVLLDASLDYEETLANVARAAVPQIADWCGISVLDDARELREVVAVHVDPAKRALGRELSERFPPRPEDPGGTSRVARTGATEFVREITDDMLVAGIPEPDRLDLVRRLGLASIIIAPLIARGRTLGTLTLAKDRGSALFGQADVRLAEELARRAGVAIANARLYTERTRIAHTLQVKLLPSRLPDIRGAVLAARYRAAGELNEVGGDFYDVFARSPTEWALVVGDVSGKGPEAAAMTALARYTLRAAALENDAPSDSLLRLNTAMLAHDDASQFATVVIAFASAAEGGGMHVRLALGGHPAPLIVRASGEVEAAGAFGTVLGMLEGPALHDAEVDLAPGDAMLLYTDGVTEAGPRVRPFGEAGLQAVLRRTAGRPPQAIVDAVERAALAAEADEPRDDIALLALSVARRA